MNGWRKSTYSSDNGGECIETATRDHAVMVRDTTDRDGATLTFTTAAWEEFTTKLK
jgi:hypothetical protein